MAKMNHETVSPSEPCEIQARQGMTVTGLTQVTLKMGADDCEQTCLETVMDEGDCWFFGVGPEVCYMWLSHSQPIEDDVLRPHGNSFVLYLKNCVGEYRPKRPVSNPYICVIISEWRNPPD